MKALRVDRGGKSISIKLKIYCQKYNIVIKYTTLYLYKKNSFIKRRKKILVIMKDSLLINSSLLNKF